MYIKTAADLRPSADGSAVHASLVAGSGIKTRKLRSRITTQTRASYPFLTFDLRVNACLITGNYSSLSSHKGADFCLLVTHSFPSPLLLLAMASGSGGTL